MKAIVIAILIGALGGQARAELWMARLGELMKDATSIEVIDVDAMDKSTGVAQGKVFETWRSKHAVGERVSQPIGAMAGLVKQGDRVLVVCDASECPRAVGVEKDGWYTLTAQEPMDGAFVVPNVVSHLSLPALVNGGPVPSLCAKGTINFLDGGSATLDAIASATTGAGGAAIGEPAAQNRRPVPVTIGGAEFGVRAREGVVVSIGDARVHGADAAAHPDCKAAGAYTVAQPGPRSKGELAAAIAGKKVTSVFARGSYRGKPLELAIEGDNIVLVGGAPLDSTSSNAGTVTYTYGKTTVVWALGGNPVEQLQKAKTAVVTVDGAPVTLRYVPAK